MRSIMIRLLALLLFSLATCFAAPKELTVYFVDVEGGQATLFVSPTGQSMLIDTGWPGFNGRDAKRIATVAKDAGVTQIDFLVITHYHTDHAGGVPQLAALMPIKHFVDHGESFEHTPEGDKLFADYAKTRESGQHIEAKPGDMIPVPGLKVRVLTAAGNQISDGGKPNPNCAGIQPKEADPSENARSLGTLITYGKFKILDLGDLTWNKESDLVCPSNRIGTVDVYLTTHHGLAQSNNPALVRAIHPRVAIMNNGAKKGGAPEAWKTVHDSPGLLDLWQVHFSEAGGASSNVDEKLIANPSATDDAGNYIKLQARGDGHFTVTNSRNGFSKSY